MTLDVFSPAVRAWFDATFDEPTPAQRDGWASIARGDHTLILAPTGSGKTLAAFLWAIDRLAAEPPPPPLERTRVLYISPLRALAVDVEKNLRAPLAGIEHAADRAGLDARARAVGRHPHRRHAAERAAPDVEAARPTSSSRRRSRST